MYIFILTIIDVIIDMHNACWQHATYYYNDIKPCKCL